MMNCKIIIIIIFIIIIIIIIIIIQGNLNESSPLHN